MTEQQEFFRRQGYPFCEKIGEGGFGEVYRLKDRDGVEVAAKLARKETEQAKFLNREAALAEHLSHSAFPKYYGLQETKEELYLLMEYIAGETLESILRHERKMDSKQIRFIGRAIAEILSYIHLKGYVYRDLKPGNLILQNDGTVRLVDLGCVLKVDQEKSKVGSVPFVAPEQLAYGACRPECDIYSWGMIMRFLVDSCMNVEKKMIGQGRSAIRRERSMERNQLNKLIKQCTETDPGKRFQDTEQLAYVLRDTSVKPRFLICQNIWKNTCRFEEK